MFFGDVVTFDVRRLLRFRINELEDLLSKSAEERDEARKDAIHKSVELLQK